MPGANSKETRGIERRDACVPELQNPGDLGNTKLTMNFMKFNNINKKGGNGLNLKCPRVQNIPVCWKLLVWMSTTAHIYFSFNTYVYDLMPASDIDARGHRLRRTISAPNKGTDTQSGFSQVRFLGGEGEGEGGSIKKRAIHEIRRYKCHDNDNYHTLDQR